MLTLGGQPLRQPQADTAAPSTADAIPPGPGEPPELAMTVAVVSEPLPGQHPFLSVEHQRGVTALVRIDTDHHLAHHPPRRCWKRRAAQCYFERSRPLLSHCPPGDARRVSTPLASHTHEHGQPVSEHPRRAPDPSAWPGIGLPSPKQVAGYCNSSGTGERPTYQQAPTGPEPVVRPHHLTSGSSLTTAGARC